MTGAAEPSLQSPSFQAPCLQPLSFSELSGWTDEAVANVWPAFRRSAQAVAAASAPLRTARPPSPALKRTMRAALDMGGSGARSFFERDWRPCRVAHPGFVTAYYEPCVEGALAPSEEFAAPILARPRDLGTRELYPDRRSIAAGAIGGETAPVVWLRDAVEVFLIQVQGSARVSLPDGRVLRLVYDGRNGRSYTSIGRLLIEQGAIAPEAMSLGVLKAWLRENGAGVGGPADDIMNRNESYIFFRTELVSDGDDSGPIGGQGVPLTAFHSLAVDRAVWSYGLPFWIDARLPTTCGSLPRLFVAQDTGSAIVGPARADLFLGSGAAAGDAAGSVRHSADVIVLLPREDAP